MLIYICFVWATYLTRSGEALMLHFTWLEPKMDAVWKITPLVTMVLTGAVARTPQPQGRRWRRPKVTSHYLILVKAPPY